MRADKKRTARSLSCFPTMLRNMLKVDRKRLFFVLMAILVCALLVMLSQRPPCNCNEKSFSFTANLRAVYESDAAPPSEKNPSDQPKEAPKVEIAPPQVEEGPEMHDPILEKTLGKYDLIVCSLVRDANKTLSTNLATMEAIGKKFKSFRMIIIENDSEDGTDKSLAKFAESRPEFVELISEKMDGKPDPNAPADPLPGDFALSALRFYKMAKLRNIYMDRLATLPEISQPNTLVMMVDLDLAKISIEGTLGSLSSILAGKKKLDSDWDLVCANGLTSECNKEAVGKQACSFVRKDNGKFGRSYDSLATRFTDQEMKHSFQIPAGQPRPPKFDDEWGNHQQYTRIKTNDRDADPIPAKSCFGGLAVYRAQSIKNLRYEGGDCEHISFNGKLDKVYIVPDFNTYYD